MNITEIQFLEYLYEQLEAPHNDFSLRLNDIKNHGEKNWNHEFDLIDSCAVIEWVREKLQQRVSEIEQ